MRLQARGLAATMAGIIGMSGLIVGLAPAASAAVTELKINEVNSNPDDWFELTNIGTEAIDISGWRYSDSSTATTYLIADGTTVPAGGFVQIASDPGLGKGDAVHLFLPDGVTQVDATTWPAGSHATSWGRFPDGTGPFKALTPTPAGANQESGPVTPPPPLDENWDDIEINEIASLNADDPGNPGFGDAVELHNTGSHPVSIEGWKQTDSGAASGAVTLVLADLKVWEGTALRPASDWIIPADGYVAFSSKKGLSGEGDAVKIYGPEGATQLVDEVGYGDGDAGVSDSHTSDARAFAACPDGSDEFWRVRANSFGRSNADACETRSRRLETSVVLNEVSNVSGKAELSNTGTTAADISGWELVDSRGAVAFTVPSGTSIAAGGFFVADPVTGLGSIDSLTIRNPEGASVLAHSWQEDGIESYSRCESLGMVSYVETPTATWGTANACPELGRESWPGPATIRTVDAVDAFTDLDANDEGDVSGAVFDPADPSILWATMNKGRLFKMHKVDGQYEALSGWEGGLPVRFADGGGELDAEGVAVGPDGAIYLTSERDNARAKSTSHNQIARFDVSKVTATTTELVATHEWDVNDLVVTGTNLGLEGIAYVPDEFLVESGWQVDGHSYRATDYATPGLFVTAVEATGDLHFFSLGMDLAPVEVKVEKSGFPWSMDVAYDADRQLLWTLCDDSCGGVYNVLTVQDGDFTLTHSYARPAGMPNLNNEGLAIAPWSNAVDGRVEVIWTDDGDTDGYSLRAGQLELPVIGEPVDPVVKVASKVTAPAMKMVYGRDLLVPVTVDPRAATGTVQIKHGTRVLGSATLGEASGAGLAKVRIPARLLAPGAVTLTLAYLGDAQTKPAHGRVRVGVAKASSKITSIRLSTLKSKASKARARVKVRVRSTTGVPATGKVQIRVGAKTFTGKVKNGIAKVAIARRTKPNATKLKVRYLGSSTVSPTKVVSKRLRWR